MEEKEQDNQEQNNEEKLQQNIQDTANMAKDSANMAKNIATGNVLGVAKDALNLLKNKKFRRRLIIKAIAPLISIILVAGLLLGVFNAVGDAIEKVLDGIVNFFTLDSDGAIVINDVDVDAIINSISDLGVSVDGLKLMGDVDYTNPNIQEANQKALRKYIREFYEAQAMTQTLNTKPNWVQEHILNNGKPYGTVYVHRTLNNEAIVNADTKTYQLKYAKYEDMLKKQEAKDEEILKYFSIDEKGKLVIAGKTRVVVKEDGVVVSDVTTINLKHIDYKNVISQYTTSMNFFVYLTMITQNPEFVSAVTDLVKMSDIRLTVLDTNSENINTETYTYTDNTKTRTKIETEDSYYYQDTVSSQQIKKVRETTTTSVIPTIKVTYVKTWFCEQTITYNRKEEKKKTSNTLTGENFPGLQDEEEPELTEEGSVSWKTDQQKQIDDDNKTSKYEEGTRGDVIDRTGEKGSQGIKDKNGNGKVDGNEIVDENSRFLGLLDNQFKIPNSTRYDSAGGNLVSGAEMFFYLLQKDQSSQNLELVMRNALYKYTGRDYGVTNLDLSIFDAKDFVSIEDGPLYGNSIEEKVWFALREMGYSEYAVAGVMGNIYAESGFNSSAVEGGTGIGFGLCQWSYGRREKLEEYAASKGKEASDVDIQIEFLLTEITPGANGPAQGYASYQMLYYNGYNGSMWENADSPENAAIAFCWSFERPGEPRMDVRTQKAREYYEQFAGKTKPAGGTIIQVADSIHKYMEENQYTYCVYFSNDCEECSSSSECGLNSTFEESKNGYHHTCCATYVSWVLQEAGYISDAEHQNGATNLNNLLISKGWTQILNPSELEPGDVLYYSYGHIEIFAGDGTVYNAGCGSAIRGAAPSSQAISTMTYGLRAPN